MTDVQTTLHTRTVAVLKDHTGNMEFVGFADFPLSPEFGNVEYRRGLQEYAEAKGQGVVPSGDYIIIRLPDPEAKAEGDGYVQGYAHTLEWTTNVVVK